MLNSVILMGRLVADPELRQTGTGISVCSFRLAVDRNFSKAGTEKQTDFINIVAWRNTGEFVSRYFKKGQLCAVQGSLQTRSYTDKEGNNRQAFEVVADNVYFADSKGSSGASTGNAYPAAAPAMSDPAPAFEMGTQDFKELEDEDLPF